MRKLFYLLFIGAAIYGVVRYVPQETKRQTLAAIGLNDFFGGTLPRYLRQKLSIPRNPVREREKLIGELSGAIERADRELGALAPSGPSAEGPAFLPKSPPPSEIRERLSKTRELLAQSEAVLGELEKANPGQSVFGKTADRVLDLILPQARDPGADGIGGDTGGGAMCPPQ